MSRDDGVWASKTVTMLCDNESIMVCSAFIARGTETEMVTLLGCAPRRRISQRKIVVPVGKVGTFSEKISHLSVSKIQRFTDMSLHIAQKYTFKNIIS